MANGTLWVSGPASATWDYIDLAGYGRVYKGEFAHVPGTGWWKTFPNTYVPATVNFTAHFNKT